jgi:hypothetical protein
MSSFTTSFARPANAPGAALASPALTCFHFEGSWAPLVNSCSLSFPDVYIMQPKSLAFCLMTPNHALPPTTRSVTVYSIAQPLLRPSDRHRWSWATLPLTTATVLTIPPLSPRSSACTAALALTPAWMFTELLLHRDIPGFAGFAELIGSHSLSSLSHTKLPPALILRSLSTPFSMASTFGRTIVFLSAEFSSSATRAATPPSLARGLPRIRRPTEARKL